MEKLREYFKTMAARQPEGVMTPLAGGWRIVVNDNEVTVVLGGDDGEMVCYATVGSFANVSEQDVFLEDALKANCFWDQTYGATLSVDPESGELVLADRREPDFVDGDEGLEAFFTQFIATLHGWKRYLANCSPDGVPADGESAGTVSSAAEPVDDLDITGIVFGQLMRIYP